MRQSVLAKMNSHPGLFLDLLHVPLPRRSCIVIITVHLQCYFVICHSSSIGIKFVFCQNVCQAILIKRLVNKFSLIFYNICAVFKTAYLRLSHINRCTFQLRNSFVVKINGKQLPCGEVLDVPKLSNSSKILQTYWLNVRA